MTAFQIAFTDRAAVGLKPAKEVNFVGCASARRVARADG